MYNSDMTRFKLVVIVGPTSSGKSDLAVTLAKHFKGEVISADSRQVYKGMDIGTGKITKKEMKGIPHHLLDLASPRQKFSAALRKKCALARERIAAALTRRKRALLSLFQKNAICSEQQGTCLVLMLQLQAT